MEISQDESLYDHVRGILSNSRLNEKEFDKGEFSFSDFILSGFINHFNEEEISKKIEYGAEDFLMNRPDKDKIRNLLIEDCCIDLGYDELKKNSPLEEKLEKLSRSEIKRKEPLKKGETDQLTINLASSVYLSNFNGTYTPLISKAEDFQELKEIFVIEYLNKVLKVKEFGDRNVKGVTDYLLNLFKLREEYSGISDQLRNSIGQLNKIVDIDRDSINRYNAHLDSLADFSRLIDIKDENERILARESINNYEFFLEWLDYIKEKIKGRLDKTLEDYNSNLKPATIAKISELDELYKLMKIGKQEEIRDLLNKRIKKELTGVRVSILNFEEELKKLSDSGLTRLGIPDPVRLHKIITLKRQIASERGKNVRVMELGGKVEGINEEGIKLYEANIGRLNKLSQDRENLLTEDKAVIDRFKRRVQIAFAGGLVISAGFVGKTSYDLKSKEIEKERRFKYNKAVEYYARGDFRDAYNISRELMDNVDSSLFFGDKEIYKNAAIMKQDSEKQADLIEDQMLEKYKQEMLEIDSAFRRGDIYNARERLDILRNGTKKTIQEYSF